MNMPDDFPPIPKCFSHILNLNTHTSNYCNTSNDSEEQFQAMLSQSLPLTFISRPTTSTNEPNNNFVRSLSDSSHQTFRNSEYSHSQVDEVFQDQSANEMRRIKSMFIDSSLLKSSDSGSTKQSQSSIEESRDDSSNQSDANHPFVKLNSSLEKLKNEMAALRLVDVNLFCQLLSLNDAMQDLKCNIGDRYSETGSEYSLGSASYMGSMSSLDEESDWGESQVFINPLQGEEYATDDDRNRQSTSSLLEQITALTQRAVED